MIRSMTGFASVGRDEAGQRASVTEMKKLFDYSKLDPEAQTSYDIWADNNSWRTGDEAQNVDQDASSFIDGDTICPAGGILLQCSSQ